jgi:hypothetical protein
MPVYLATLTSVLEPDCALSRGETCVSIANAVSLILLLAFYAKAYRSVAKKTLKVLNRELVGFIGVPIRRRRLTSLFHSSKPSGSLIVTQRFTEESQSTTERFLHVS